jgi:alpha-D-xyloside xylohydrolase
MKKHLKILFLLQLIITICFSSCKTDALISYQKNPHGVVFKLQKGNLEVNVIADNVLQCRYYLTDTAGFKKSLMVVDRKQDSVNWKLEEKDGSYLVKTSKIIAVIDSKTGLISYFDKDMKPIVKENDRQLEPKEISGEKVFNLSQTFGLSSDEAIYGLGQTQTGAMNLRNDSLELYQKNKEDYIPVFVSTNGYGVLWDNYSYTLFKDNARGMNLWSEVGDGIDYYFMYGPDLDHVIASYRNITGGCPMLPKWAFGYVQSKERYKTQDEILDVVKEYRQRQIPLDAIVEDWQHWPEGQWGQKSFDASRFPDPAGMISDLHTKYNTKFMISIWGVMTMGFPNSNEIMKTPGSNWYRIKPDEIFYDPFNPVSAGIYWKQCNEGLFSKGVDAWWCDATEPEIDRAFFISADSVRNKMTTSMGSGARYMNAFPLMHSKNMYESQRKVTSGKRVVNLTRSGFGGQQRYSTVVWSGDIMASWDVFQKQIPAGLNFCSSGIPYWTTDIGAFFITPRGNDGGYDLGTMDEEYKELYLRWFEYGAFCPMFRSHGTDFPREVWRFGEKGSWCYDALLKTDQLRYRLLPYIYSIAWKTTSQGYTPMRTLAFDFRTDTAVYNIKDQFMFGPAFLVNPVTEPMYNFSAGKMQVIPSSQLFSNGNTKGLKAEYFNGKNFESKITERVDTAINFHWPESPVKGVNEEQFSVRWTGELLSKDAGEYSFISSNDDGVRVYIDGKLIINDWKNHSTETNIGKIELKANTRYTIKIEYFDNIYDGIIKLSWMLPSTGKKIVANGVKSRMVYLPGSVKWYNFWTGEVQNGQRKISAKAPIDQMPLFVKAGSIIPMGPVMQYSTEKPAGPLEIRVYIGADGSFTLYEDENDNYQYENGLYSEITFTWNEAAKNLIIGKRKGDFPRMMKQRKFNVVFVSDKSGIGASETQKPDFSINYNGREVKLKR